jgi:glutathione S-transferase
MKILESTFAPNPRRVRIFLAEKGIQVPYEQVDIGKAENRKPEFLEKNPMGGVPVLQLDDGTYLAESVAICRYFEELHPEPPLMGIDDAKDRALVEMWQRRMELNLFMLVAQCFRNTHDFFKGRIPQVPEYGQVCKEAATKTLGWLDGVLADREFIAALYDRRHHRALLDRLRSDQRDPHRRGPEEPQALARRRLVAPKREGLKGRLTSLGSAAVRAARPSRLAGSCARN